MKITGALRQIAIALMLLGVFGVAINLVFGANTIINITKETSELTGYTYYKYDFSNYFKNLALNIGQIQNINIELPTRQWQNEIINDLAVILDYLILILNVILYPLRFGAYIVSVIFAILGVEYQQVGMRNWLVIFIYSLQKAYIPYV